ncbi:MAG TPA: PhoH family protein [Opitutales bacterium]|nr:PhoH family protein [Opitutales bacterium]
MEPRIIKFANPRLLNQLYCGKETNLAKAEQAFDVKIVTREDWLQVEGAPADQDKVAQLFDFLSAARTQGMMIGQTDFDHMLDAVKRGDTAQLRELFENPITLRLKRTTIVPKTINQKRYLQFIRKAEIVFGIGPAGTGKTYLAVASALQALMENQVEKIILARPAVEAGEALGFLPGDLREKILPYLRPLHDAMYEMLGKEESERMIEKGVIEIAPLAYMRGRTLTNAYVLLDEAQNTTPEQMVMFLTRLGDHSRMIITGDITQVDLPRSKISGLKQAVQVLQGIEGIKLFYFDLVDVVRHPLVSAIIKAYDEFHADSSRSD